MKYLIYGCTSLISINLIKKLINKNNNLNFIVFVRSKSKFEKLLASFNLTKYLDKIDLIEINITNLNENLNLISKFKDNCLDSFNKIKKLNVAVIGEIIFDEYIFYTVLREFYSLDPDVDKRHPKPLFYWQDY